MTLPAQKRPDSSPARMDAVLRPSCYGPSESPVFTTMAALLARARTRRYLAEHARAEGDGLPPSDDQSVSETHEPAVPSIVLRVGSARPAPLVPSNASVVESILPGVRHLADILEAVVARRAARSQATRTLEVRDAPPDQHGGDRYLAAAGTESGVGSIDPRKRGDKPQPVRRATGRSSRCS